MSGLDDVKILKFQKLAIFDSNYTLKADIKTATSATFNVTPEWVKQLSGNSLFPVENEVGSFNSECTLNVGEYGKDLLDIVLGAKSKSHDIAAAKISQQKNIKGTTLLSAKGITIIEIKGTGEETKSGFYKFILSDKANKKVQIYAITSPDLIATDYTTPSTGYIKEITIGDGDAKSDTGLGITWSAAAAVDLDDAEDGDYFIARVFAKGTGAFSAEIGRLDLEIPEVKVACISKTISRGRWVEVIFHRCTFAGSNIMFGDEFANTDITGTALFDSTVGMVGEYHAYAKK